MLRREIGHVLSCGYILALTKRGRTLGHLRVLATGPQNTQQSRATLSRKRNVAPLCVPRTFGYRTLDGEEQNSWPATGSDERSVAR